MQAFAHLLDRLVFTPARNGKLKLLRDYFAATPDPDRGIALAALTGSLSFRTVKPKVLRELITERMDAELFRYSYDYIGDLAETIALAWPNDAARDTRDVGLAELVSEIAALGRTQTRNFVRDTLDVLPSSQRFAFLKLITGGLRIGVSARMAKQALAQFGDRDIMEIETLWHGLEPPYENLFAWLEGKADKPVLSTPAIFHSVMLANPLSDGDLEKLSPDDYLAEWKWDGIRVQLSRAGDTCRLYSRSGDDISHTFPEIIDAATFEGVIDGELLIGGTARTNASTRTFSDLQQRLNRKAVSDKLIAQYPAFVRAYDVLFDGETDMRDTTLQDRRDRLASIIDRLPHDRFDISRAVEFADWSELEALRQSPPDPVIEGVMLKHRQSTYQPGRPKGPWFKWKRDPFTIDAVLMYAQRGHGKRSSYYSDFTFGVWTENPEGGDQLVPVGKAYFGFTDAELEVLDRYVRNHTVERFGPVRAVRANPDEGFVLEIAFEGINRSNRHKSGVAMRFPRIARLRQDKRPADADRLETLMAMIA